MSTRPMPRQSSNHTHRRQEERDAHAVQDPMRVHRIDPDRSPDGEENRPEDQQGRQPLEQRRDQPNSRL